MLKFINSPPKASSDVVSKFLMKSGINLPSDYIDFLFSINGGKMDPPSFYSKSKESIVYSTYMYGLFDSDKSVSSSLETNAFDLWGWSLPTFLLPIATDGCGNDFVMSVRSSDFGCIYFRDHEVDHYEPDEYDIDGAIPLEKIFISFSDFIHHSVDDPLESDFEKLLRSKDVGAITQFIENRKEDINTPVYPEIFKDDLSLCTIHNNMLDIIFLAEKYKEFQMPEIIEVLLTKGAQSDFFRLGKEYLIDITKMMLNRGMGINNKEIFGRDYWTYPILTHVKNQSDFELFDFYLQNGADINLKDSEGNRALYYATMKYQELDAYEHNFDQKTLSDQKRIVEYLEQHTIADS